MTDLSVAVQAQARLHHALLLGLQLMVSTRKDAAVVEDWMFRLFRRQHEEKFLDGLAKLGLEELPHAVACAQYHVLSNGIGGVQVEYLPENERKAWVRFRYPRWMYDGPVLCGIPVEVSRGFLHGWYAHNGVSLGNPRLGFVCVSEDMTGEFGLCGYFQEFDEVLAPDRRLQFARGELPPAWCEQEQPRAPAAQWSTERLARARRNYAVEFCRNAVLALAAVLGTDEAGRLAGQAARLIGLQYGAEMRRLTGTADGDLDSAADFLLLMFQGMGDTVTRGAGAGRRLELHHGEPKILRGLQGEERAVLLDCWRQLWTGMLMSYRQLKTLRLEDGGDGLIWRLTDFRPD